MRWAFLLGGPLIWTAHFFGVYTLASFADIDPSLHSVRVAIILLSLVAALLNATLLYVCVRPRARGFLAELSKDEERFWRSAAGSGAFISLVAVLWQGLPAVLPL